MSEEIVNDPAKTEGDSIALLLREVMEQRDGDLLSGLRKEILRLGKPEREEVADVLPGGDPATERAAPQSIVSRNQPSDSLYRKLSRDTNGAFDDYRTPDLDHWHAEWLRGLVLKDRVRQAVAEDRLVEVSGQRAVTTYSIGALDASDPTAILDGSGGSLLPQNLANVIEIARDLVSVMPGLVMNLSMTSGTLRVPTATAFTAEMAAEGATSDEAGPTFASVMLKAQKMSAFAKLSIEMLADSAFNVVSILGGRAGAAMGALEDVQICTSSGTPPNISAPISGTDTAETTITEVDYVDMPKLYFALTAPYRRNAVWLGNGFTLNLLSTILGTDGRPVLQMANAFPAPVVNADNQVGQIFGKGVYEVPFANGLLMFGDPNGYVMGRRSGITAASSTESSFASDIVDFKFTERFDGNMVDASALVEFNGLATVT